MPDLSFRIEGAKALAYAAVPTIALGLRISNTPAEQPVHTIVLRCQTQIEPSKRRYSCEEQSRLHDLYGEPSRWGQTVKPLHWMNTTVTVPSFSGETDVDLELPCSFDFNVAATKYFHALEAGEVPLTVMFSGTVFYAESDGRLQATQIPWDREASYRLPVEIWKQMMDAHYPNSAWLCLQRDAFERLLDYKVRNSIPTFERALEELLAQERELAAASKSSNR
ncbi:MAG: DUF6084 family protein [Candidatus Korobacteraceae bacterium]